MRIYNKYIRYLKANNKTYYYFTLGGFQPVRDLIGDPYDYQEGNLLGSGDAIIIKVIQIQTLKWRSSKLSLG